MTKLAAIRSIRMIIIGGMAVAMETLQSHSDGATVPTRRSLASSFYLEAVYVTSGRVKSHHPLRHELKIEGA